MKNQIIPSIDLHRVHIIQSKKQRSVQSNSPLAALVAAQHKHHQQGKSKCGFAQFIYSRPEKYGAQFYICDKHIGEVNRKTEVDAIANAIRESITDSDCQFMSIILPRINVASDLALFIETLLQIPEITLGYDVCIDNLVGIGLRWNFANGVKSWLLGFGPFQYMPASRRTPYTELVVRTKLRDKDTYHKTSKDESSAHLADIPMKLNDTRMGALWQHTIDVNKKTYGDDKTVFAKAKVTFSLPKSWWTKEIQYG